MHGQAIGIADPLHDPRNPARSGPSLSFEGSPAQAKPQPRGVVVDELTRALVGNPVKVDFSDLVGKWTPDPAFDEIIASQRRPIDGTHPCTSPAQPPGAIDVEGADPAGPRCERNLPGLFEKLHAHRRAASPSRRSSVASGSFSRYSVSRSLIRPRPRRSFTTRIVLPQKPADAPISGEPAL